MMRKQTSTGKATVTARRCWPPREWKKRVGWAATALGLTGLAAPATWPQGQAPDLTKMNIEELMNVDVTSASKKAERLSAAPAAIFVVTGEEIQRGGFSCVPDALRMVPGMHVSQQSSHVWQVSARGFSSFLNNKMLVLIDGRLVYALTFGGVWWDVQDPPLEDIERIEVIRGPGGTLWGANAVNGVINIITKESGETQGAQVVASAGAGEGYGARVRYGGMTGKDFAYRLYGTSNYWLPTVNATGGDLNDTWNISQGGMRFDWKASPKDTVTFDGEGYDGRVRDIFEVLSPTAAPNILKTEFVVKGGHLLSRWKHSVNARSATDVLGYCDWTNRADIFAGESRDVCDLEFQHNYAITDRQSVTWGGSILTSGQTGPNGFAATYVPLSRRDTTYSGFLQYDISMARDKLRVIAGSKIEHNNYTGFEYQPQIRGVWTPAKSQSVWVAVSRAVRTPSRAERDAREASQEVSDTPPTIVFFTGNPNLKAESVTAYELGYRYEWRGKFWLDAAAYYNGYENLVGVGPLGPPAIHPDPFYIAIPLPAANVGGGQTHGLELYFKYTPIHRWTVSMGITELRGNSAAGVTTPAVANDPRYMANVQSRLDFTRDVNFDVAYYYYDAIRPSIEPVNRIDAGISTKPIRGFTFSIWGRNLETARHSEAAEFVPQVLQTGEIRRSVVFKLIWESKGGQGKAQP
jgi:iron complex outermembrane receptor protein